MTQTELHETQPRDKTVQDFTEHTRTTHPIKDTDNLEISSSILHHSGDKLEVTFECPHCTYTITEIYTLRYVTDGDNQYERNQVIECDCEECQLNEPFFTEIRRKKVDSKTAIAVAKCKYCEKEWKDVFKYQLNR